MRWKKEGKSWASIADTFAIGGICYPNGKPFASGSFYQYYKEINAERATAPVKPAKADKKPALVVTEPAKAAVEALPVAKVEAPAAVEAPPASDATPVVTVEVSEPPVEAPVVSEAVQVPEQDAPAAKPRFVPNSAAIPVSRKIRD